MRDNHRTLINCRKIAAFFRSLPLSTQPTCQEVNTRNRAYRARILHLKSQNQPDSPSTCGGNPRYRLDVAETPRIFNVKNQCKKNDKWVSESPQVSESIYFSQFTSTFRIAPQFQNRCKVSDFFFRISLQLQNRSTFHNMCGPCVPS